MCTLAGGSRICPRQRDEVAVTGEHEGYCAVVYTGSRPFVKTFLLVVFCVVWFLAPICAGPLLGGDGARLPDSAS